LFFYIFAAEILLKHRGKNSKYFDKSNAFGKIFLFFILIH